MKHTRFDFNQLIVLDLANNHQGNVEHGTNIIKEIAKIVKKYDVKAGIKFQFRQLKTFIHKNHQIKTNAKHIPRFLETELDRNSYEKLITEVKQENLITICTPFDEASVDLVVDMDFDILKIASCSATDWPLLEKAASSGKPIICSTGGLNLSQIDDLYSFFNHQNVDFSFMHCVSIYPSKNEDLQLNQIDLMKKRYPDICIGWSTHEDQDEIAPVQIAFGKGANMFERHVGIETENIKLNAYSSTPSQIENWIKGIIEARKICGTSNERHEINPIEIKSLESLQRGVYAKKNLNKGDVLKIASIYYSMPIEIGQLPSGKFKENITIKSSIKKDKPIFESDIILPLQPDDIIIKKAIHEVKAMLSEAKIFLNSEFEVEYSHHYGIKNFRETGVVIINVINREYCKKILVQLPNQMHPAHHHKLKEETFQILSGSLDAIVDGKEKHLLPGDLCLVLPGVWHSFSTKTGCIFEEISTTHYNNDSVYRDKMINNLKRDKRKTKVNHWGRYELPYKTSK